MRWMSIQEWSGVLAALLTLLVAIPAASAQSVHQKPAIVAALASTDEFLTQAEAFLQPLRKIDPEGIPPLGDFIRPMLAGFDQAKPCGLVVSFDDQQPIPVGFVPITDFDKALSSLENCPEIPAQVTDAGPLQRVTIAGVSVLVKESGGYAYFAQNAAHLDDLPDPQLTAPLLKSYQAALVVNAENVPALVKKLGLAGFSSVLAGLAVNSPWAKDPQVARLLVDYATLSTQMLTTIVLELRQLVLGVSAGSPTQPAVAEVLMTLKPEGQASRWLVPPQQVNSRFAGVLGEKALVQANLTGTIPQGQPRELALLQAQLARQLLLVAIRQSEAFADDQERELCADYTNELMDLIENSIKAGQLDAVSSYQLSAAGRLQSLSAVHLAEGKKWESLVKKLVRNLQESEISLPTVKFDVWKHQGVSLHTVSLPDVSEDEEALLGPHPQVFLGFSSNAVWVALGGEGTLATLKAAIDQSAAGNPSQPVKPASYSLSGQAILETMLRSAPASMQELGPRLRQFMQAGDQVQATIDAADQKTLRCRLKVGRGLITTALGLSLFGWEERLEPNRVETRVDPGQLKNEPIPFPKEQVPQEKELSPRQLREQLDQARGE